MFIILLATTLSGVLFAKLLLLVRVADFRVRYPLIVIFSYLVFFACIKLWLHFMTSAKISDSSGEGGSDLFDIPVVGSSRGLGQAAVRGGGGEFLGAGASGSFDAPETAAAASAALSGDSASAASSGAETVSDTVGGAADSLGDADIIAVVIVLLVLLGTILASSFLIIYSAPAILAEAAFQGVLAVSLARKARSVADGAWIKSVLKDTWKPFAAALGVTVLASIALHVYFPEATKLADVVRTLSTYW